MPTDNNAYTGNKYDSQVAPSYDADREVERHWWAEDAFVARYFQNRPVKTLLDLPVGTGRFFRHYQTVGEVTGVDISTEMLAEARAKADQLPTTTTYRLEKGDVFALTYPSHSFEVTLVWRLLHLLPPEFLPQAVKELCRVTSGELVVQTYTLPNLWDRRWHRLSVKLGLRPQPTEHVARESVRKAAPPPTKPWSHIPAYYHPQSYFDALFAKAGWERKEVQFLDEYTGCDVRVAIYRPTH